MRVYCLDDLLRPHDSTEFINTYFLGKQFIHICGEPERFSKLLDWQAVNRMLETCPLDPARLRIVKEGKVVDPSALRRGSGEFSDLSPGVLDFLRDGATLIINGVQQLHKPVALLTQRLERIFRAPIAANLYAGWHSSRGFDLHWDDHDVLILQLAGEKHWELHGLTERYPVDRKLAVANPPTAGAVWKDRLRDGDVLYIPRGVWHIAYPCDQPTLHLTIGIQTPVGIDFIRWVANNLVEIDEMRMDLPRLASPVEQAEYLQRIRLRVATALGDDGLLNKYFDHLDSLAQPRLGFGLPWSATDGVLPPDEDSVISVLPLRGLQPQQLGDGIIAVGFGGRICRFNQATAPLFEYLDRFALSSLGAFLRTFADAFDLQDLTAFLKELVTLGIVALDAPNRPQTTLVPAALSVSTKG
jgi:hypothetical protein